MKNIRAVARAYGYPLRERLDAQIGMRVSQDPGLQPAHIGPALGLYAQRREHLATLVRIRLTQDPGLDPATIAHGVGLRAQMCAELGLAARSPEEHDHLDYPPAFLVTCLILLL